MAYYYLKLYHEILDDPKMGRLSDHLYRRVIELFLIASASTDRDGFLPPVEDMAWKLRTSPAELLADLSEIEKTAIVKNVNGNWYVTNFVKRQAASTTTERTREFKKREQSKDTTRKSGIYKIECEKSGKVYIGASVDIERRLKVHFSEGKSFPNHWMHNDLLKFGKQSFIVGIVELVDNQEFLAERETYWINQYPKEKLYNNESEGKYHRDWERTGNETFPNSSIELESDIDIESDIEENKTNKAASSLPTDPDLLTIFVNTTGNPAFPSSSYTNDLIRLRAVYSVKGADTTNYLKPYWAEWVSRGYSRSNTAWLDWAVAGHIPERKTQPRNNNGSKSAAVEDTIKRLMERKARDNGNP